MRTRERSDEFQSEGRERNRNTDNRKGREGDYYNGPMKVLLGSKG